LEPENKTKNSSEPWTKSFSQFNRKITIAIDGPAAAGKSTTARLLAKKLDYLYIDTGAMYRALTWKALRDKIDIKNKKALSELAKKTQIELKSGPNLENKVYLDNQDVTSFLRSPEVNRHVSSVSAVKEVREVLVAQQRQIGKKGGIVAEGRDMTTVVFPEADLKIFLKASLEERTRRRWIEEKEKGLSFNKKEIATGLTNRDKIDSQRKISPLKISQGVIVIDNTYLNISQTINKIVDVLKNKLVR